MFTEDLSEFFSTDDFAVAATLQGGGAGAVKVIFDEAALQQLGVMTGTNLVALVKATDVAATDVGKTLTINGVAYTIRAHDPIDDGALVQLQLSAP
jgi:hypothetical protein